MVEPVIKTTKKIENGEFFQGGDDVIYEIRVRHDGSSNVDAFDLGINDVLPTEMSDYTILSVDDSDSY